MAVAELGSEVFPWLKSLPLAPEYHPTLAEFQDPIAYIFKIEQEASKYGICKIVPPLPPPPKRTTIVNLNRSLAARVSTLRSKSAPTFTTRQQQIGFCPRKPRPVQKPVWQSGEYYTFQQFEAKAKNFEKNYLKKSSKKSLSALEIETLFWKASVDKPFSIEYANDMPGSAFVPVEAEMEAGEAVTVGETAWNMRRVSKSKESLLRFMKEEIPGVTSPMVYIAMIFSWFAWHVEDHDLHSLNYLHLGAGKTWYGVPRDAAVAFEEVVRVYGYGEEVNPLVTFAILGEKTTVMSPEVFIKAGIPCCRLVQNPGEFVVTFPRAYHSGFSHGFNCAEASNIATPGWLRVAKEAAVRRASINYPPMVSHLQLLYDLALALSSRIPKRIGAEPRSSRLKDKKKGEGQTMIKELFVQNVVQNNDLLQILGKGSPIVLLPASYSDTSICSNFCARSKLKLKPRLSLGLSSQEEAIKASNGVVPDDVMLDTNGVKQLKGFYSLEENVLFPIERYRFSSNRENGDASTHMSYARRQETERGSNNLSDQKLFSCVKCGILSYDCVAIVQPKHAAAKYLMSADCSFFNDWVICSGVINDGSTISSKDVNSSKLDSTSGWMGKRIPDGLYEVPIQSMDDQIQVAAQSNEMLSDTEVRQDTNSLGLLALNYGNSSDSEDDDESDTAAEANIGNCSAETELHGGIGWNSYKRDHNCCPSERSFRYSSRSSDEDEASFQTLDPSTKNRHRRANFQDRNNKTFDEIGTDSPPITMDDFIQRNSSTPTTCSNAFAPMVNEKVPFASRSDEDSSRMHIFCLEHASEVEQQLSPIGGVHMLLLCHADYPRVEARAKSVAEELGFDHIWNNVVFRDATRDDEEKIQSALNSEDAIPSNGDWAVKLGINLYYSVILSHSPLYSKQMPYNSIIYNAFGRNSTVDSLTKPKVQGKWVGRHKKIVVAGKWCGKVWMSNQVHPLLVPRDQGEGEEFEQERGFSSWARPDEIRAETGCRAEFTPVTKKLYKRRKTGEDARRTEVEDLVETSEDSADDFHQYQNCQNLRNKRVIRCNSEQKHIQSNSFSEDEGGPSTRLRKRNKKYPSHSSLELEPKIAVKKRVRKTKAEKARAASRWSPVGRKEGNAKQKKIKDDEGPYVCDADGCTMCFDSKPELALHKRNICPVKGCGKKFFSHKYLLQHRRVHLDDRPLKCPWKGCKMTFKWAWARTEHIRVHTGARPYICAEPGCGQTFRFVSDFSRHKRKTGHSVKKGKSK